MRLRSAFTLSAVVLVVLAGCTTVAPPLSTVEAAEQAHPCLAGSAYSPVTGAMVTVEPWTVTVYPGPDDRPLILTRSTTTGTWGAADAVSRQILAELGCT